MASTYTVNTGIEKPDTGDQSGTWGETTNVNFDIIDRAVSGVGNIVLSGSSHTLTTSDGALSDGGYRVLIFGGSPTGTNTVTIDPSDQEKFYVAYNNSGQTIILTQGSGGNVTIANGDTKIVYANGGGASAKVTEVGATMPVGGASVTELGYLAGVTSSIQTQLNTLSTSVSQFLPAGTKMLFQQTSAPTGWTKETSNFNDSAIRVTTGNTGSGGSNGFSTLFTGNVAGTISTSLSGNVDGHTLTSSEIPSHRHFIAANVGASYGGGGDITNSNYIAKSYQSPYGGGGEIFSYTFDGVTTDATQGLTSATGSGGSHNHGVSGVTATSTFTGTTSMAVNYVDVIIASKN